ncbi:multidrug transporter [Sandarakinorhabdus cyanobacteriorum]|uniref:Multidrug transporter n=1 Tax=Sandarakinorhabdus cyanobacteriorum TaxID=1981098 RepID=A0A255YFE1_9SPHN|nr:SapC family protein [Sandarakinorhabdus cyanobacteriorum]OYQ27190.1 multidrug transporter [Sandarakinorhabdus cyanobacteriorum]
MANHQILNFEQHGALRVLTGAGAALGDAVMACLVVPLEFRRLANDYPILFRRDDESGDWSALALFGFEPGENLFLEGDRWLALNRPLAMAAQPFLVGRTAAGEGPGQVHIDMDHPRVSRSGEGVKLFEPGGQPTPHVELVADMLGALDEGYRASGGFFAALARYDLIEPFSLDVTLDNGAMHRLVGYHLINEDRLAALEPGALAELQAEGHLQPIYMALASLGNLARLVRRKNQLQLGDG